MNELKASCGAAGFVLLTLALCAGLEPQAPSPKSPGVNQDSLVIESFEKNVAEYVKLHKKAEGGLPAAKPTDSSHTINERRRLLATKIEAARASANRGDLFSPEVSQLFKRLIAMAYQSSGPTKVRTSLRHDEPVRDVRMQVNASYPETVPLQTTPPSILLNLPPLPPELDYRIVGQDLVLRDTAANIIVDYIPSAIPRS